MAPIPWIWLNWKDLRGGRNGGDPPLAIDPTQVNEALNVDYTDGTVAHKRTGSTNLSLTFTSGGPFASGIRALGRHVAVLEQDAELWAADGSLQIGRLSGVAVPNEWLEPTLIDAMTTSPQDWMGLSFNSKFHQFYDTTQNRSHLFEGAEVRRTGLPAPSGTPTVVETGGAVTDLRKYRSSVIKKTGSTIDLRSELNETATGVRTLTAERATVTLVGAPGEVETHWELWAASDDDNYATYRYIGEAAIGNTIEDNNASLTGAASALTGTYLVPPSAKYAIADDARILMAGNWETAGVSSYGRVTPKNNRVWWTPVLGDLDISDDERIVITTQIRNYLDVTRPITALGGPIFTSPFVFAYRDIWRFVPTGEVTAPYRRLPLGTPFGCIHFKSVCVGEDEDGKAALYFASHLGIYRISVVGVEYCFWDNQDLWSAINLAATIPVHCVYHGDRHQLWVHLATGSNDYPNERLVFHTRYGERTTRKGVVHGWTRHTGDTPSAAASVLFANTIGTTMSKDLKPYIGRSTGTAIHKADSSATTDAGTQYQAYLERSIDPAEGSRYKIGPSYISAKAAAGVTLQLTLTPDFGTTLPKTDTRALDPKGTETRVFREFEDSILGGQELSTTLKLGDSAATDTSWTLDQWKVKVTPEETQ